MQERAEVATRPRASHTEHPLEPFFHPRSIAVVGASSKPSGRGGGCLEGFLAQKFAGPLYPVNPKADTILGLKAFPSVLDIPGPVDYVISSIPAPAVPALIRECGAKGVRLVHLFTAGFGESGDRERAGLEQETLRLAREGGMRLVGPNSMGLYCPSGGLAWSKAFPVEPGSVGVVSQSGVNAGAIIEAGVARGLRFSKVVSFGNGLDLNEADFIEYLGSDPETTVIGAYLEGVKDGRRFRQVLERAAQQKPVVILKGGRTDAGSRAAASHTGSLAGNSQIWDALCRQTGAFRVFSLDELADTLTAFEYVAAPAGPRVAMIGMGGGFSVLGADDCVAAGLDLPWFSSGVQERLREFIPVAGSSVRNPVDSTVPLRDPESFSRTVRLIAASGEIDCFLVHLSVGLPQNPGSNRFEELVRTLQAGIQATDLPMALVTRVNAPEQAGTVQRLVERCSSMGLAVFPSVAAAASAMAKRRMYTENRERRQPSHDLYHH